jgi:hypothetical protein
MKYALDIDGVIASTFETVRQAVIAEFGMSPEQLEYTGSYHNMYKSADGSVADSAIDAFISKLYREDGPVYENASCLVPDYLHFSTVSRQLNAIHGDISYVPHPSAYITRRPFVPEVVGATTRWLEANDFPRKPLHFIPRGTCKSVKMGDVTVDFIVEDSPDEIASIVANGGKVIVMEQPYNLEIEPVPGKVARVKDWVELSVLLDNIKRDYEWTGEIIL